MKTIIEDNYLGFRLEIEIDSENRTVYGSLLDKNDLPWEINDYTEVYSASAICDPSDKFTEFQGIKLVKLKLAKMYYSDMKYIYGDIVRMMTKALEENTEILNHHKKKLENIENSLERDYQMTFTNKKPVKNSTTTKTGKKNKSKKSK